MAMTIDSVLDIVQTTLAKFEKLKFTSYAETLQEYEAYSNLIKKNRYTEQSGNAIETQVIVNPGNGAEMTGLFATDSVRINDVWKKTSIPWRHMKAHYGWEFREFLTNRGESRIQDLIGGRRYTGMLAVAELLEDQFWSAPTGTSDTTNLFGVPYWVTQSDTEGYSGANHSSFSAGKGGLSSTDYPRYKNYTAKYTSVSKLDLVKKMKTAFRKMQWKPVIKGSNQWGSENANRKIYAPESVVSAFESLGESQNDNLGNDLDPMAEKMVLRRAPIVWTPILDNTTKFTNAPVYCLDLDTFQFIGLQGDVLRESKPVAFGTSHNTIVVWIDLTANIVCRDLKRQAVFTTGAV